MLELNPANGAVLNRFAAPFDVSFGGLAVDPSTGHLWIGSERSTAVAEVQPDGTPVRQLDLAPQGLRNEVTGLAFHSSGQLLASSLQGVVYVLEIPSVPQSAQSASQSEGELPIIASVFLTPAFEAAILPARAAEMLAVLHTADKTMMVDAIERIDVAILVHEFDRFWDWEHDVEKLRPVMSIHFESDAPRRSWAHSVDALLADDGDIFDLTLVRPLIADYS